MPDMNTTDAPIADELADGILSAHNAFIAAHGDEASPAPKGADVGTRAELLNLAAHRDEWTEAHNRTLEFLAKRLDLSSKLHEGYRANGTRKGFNTINDGHSLLLAGWLFTKHAALGPNAETAARRFNVAFKAIAAARSSQGNNSTALNTLEAVTQRAWNSVSTQLADARAATTHTPSSANNDPAGGRQTLPLTVLFYEGPIARAYLAMLHSLNLQPEKLIELVAANDVVTKKPVGKWLPAGLRHRYAASVQRNKIHYWPKTIARQHPELVGACKQAVSDAFQINLSVLDDALALHPMERYCDRTETLPITGLKDPVLHDYVGSTEQRALLYTGGGIVPGSLLRASSSKFLHVHPGFLPDVRGADCSLWSALIHGHCAATCFYMAEGIDTGEIIKAERMPALNTRAGLSSAAQDADVALRYRSVYAFIDPWVRAAVLRSVVQEQGADLYNINATAQEELEGTTYHFMHNQLRDTATRALFGS